MNDCPVCGKELPSAKGLRQHLKVQHKWGYEEATKAAGLPVIERHPRRAGIYRISTPDGRAYIGQSVDVHTRLRTHLTTLRAGKHINATLQAAHDTCGGQLTYEVVEYCDRADLDDRERHHMEREGVLNHVSAPIYRSLPPQVDTERLVELVRGSSPCLSSGSA